MTQKQAEAQWRVFKQEVKTDKTEKFKKWAEKDAEFVQRIVNIKKEIALRRETLKAKLSAILDELHGMKRAGLTCYNEKYEDRWRALESVQSELAALKIEQAERLANNAAERVEVRRQFETVMSEINANLKRNFAELWAQVEIPTKPDEV